VLTFKRLQPPAWGPLDHRFKKTAAIQNEQRKAGKKGYEDSF
jgi:hypothetical protein